MMQTSWLSMGMLALALGAGLQSVPGRRSNPHARKAAVPTAAPLKVLIVMDERPQMEALGEYLHQTGDIETEIVDQKTMPERWSEYRAVIGYIHGRLDERTEVRIIDYTRSGGRFVCLHHMISSGKSKNRYYFDFLGVHMDGIELARQPAETGGHYGWREGIEQTIVNLNPAHYITSHNVVWPRKTNFAASGYDLSPGEYPAMTISDSEAYMNVKFTDGNDKIILLGSKYLDDRNQVLYQQVNEGWIKRAGKGWIVYIQMGHTVHECENRVFGQIVLNAIRWTSPADSRN
jgi:hypothetical protein